MTEFPTGWVVAKLQTLSGAGGLIADGDWIESKDQDPDGEVRLVQLADIGDGFFRNRSSKFVTALTAQRLRCTFLKKGDLLIARMPDPLGRACIFPGLDQEAITSVDVLIWRGQDGGIDIRWLMYIINSPDVRAIIAGQASGSTRQRIATGRLKELELPVPPLAEQKRSVAKVDSLTAKITKAREELSKIDILITRLKEKVLERAFNGRLTPSENQGWAASSIGGIAKDIRYGTAKKCQFDPSQTPVLRIPNVVSGQINYFELKHAKFDRKEIDKLALEEGDILVIRSNGSVDLVGRSAVVQKEQVGWVFAGYIIRIRIDLKILLPDYVNFYLQSPEIRRRFVELAKSTSGVNNVNSQQLSALPISFPSVDKQDQIVRNVRSAFSKIDQIAAEANRALALTSRLDQAILARAFKGGLVPQDPNDEPASVLLERIERQTGAKLQEGSGSDGKARDEPSTPRAPRTSERSGRMEKARSDVNKDHLAILLKAEGNMFPEKLWRQSGMSIDEFYKQLRLEIGVNSIRVSDGSELEAA